MKISIGYIDMGPPELFEAVPIRGTVLKVIPGPDRPDYTLVKLDRPITGSHGGPEFVVRYLVVAARLMGLQFGPGKRDVPANIAYVIDESVLTHETLEFSKCLPVGVGAADIG
jgi:hypothetical protein